MPGVAAHVGVPKFIGIAMLLGSVPQALYCIALAVALLSVERKGAQAGERAGFDLVLLISVVLMAIQNSIAVIAGIKALRRSSYSFSLLGSVCVALNGFWVMVCLGLLERILQLMPIRTARDVQEADNGHFVVLVMCLLGMAFYVALGGLAFLALRRPGCRQHFRKQSDLLEAAVQGALTPLGFQPKPEATTPTVLIIVAALYALAFVIGRSLVGLLPPPP
jgi:hypothetical protein